MTFRSLTAGPRVDDTKTTAPHPSELSTCETSALVEHKPVSKDEEGRKNETPEKLLLMLTNCAGMKPDEIERCNDI